LRIAYIVTRSDSVGGVQVHVRDLAAQLKAQGHFPTILTGGNGPFVQQLRARSIPTISLRHLAVPIHPMRDLLALREIRRVLRDLRPDLLAVHSAKAGILGRLAGRSLHIPVVLTAHGWTFTPGIPTLPAAVYRQMERSVGPFTSKIIAVSEFDRQLALEARIVPENRLVTVYNGTPDVPAQLRADPSRSPARLVMVARFEAQKDHATLLHALAGLKDQPWEADLIGEGPLRASMESLAAGLGIADRIHFLGQRTDVDQILSQAQISLLITNWEGFPITILEAMRAGLPVVASSVAGNGEAISEGTTGFLVPRGDAVAVRDRVGRLLTDPGLRARMGSNGRARYQQHFTLDHFVTQTLAVYHSVLTGSAGARPELLVSAR
jgi:glycosyltransferase involved in cell wall biosynthesis